jgi:hypothetical protein
MEKLQTTAREFYAALDARDWSALQRLTTPGFVASVSDLPPMGLAEWRRQPAAFQTRAFRTGATSSTSTWSATTRS